MLEFARSMMLMPKDDSRKALIEAVRHHQQGRLDRAAALYQRLLKANPRDADALHLLGLVHHQRGQQSRAERLIAQAITVNGREPAYHNSLGTVRLALGRIEDAADCFRRALGLDPLCAEAHNNLGNALQKLGRLDEAIESYRHAVTIRPGYAEAHCNQGRAWHALGALDEAVNSFRLALKAKPEYVKALRHLGDALAELGETDEAEAFFRRALDLEPKDAEAEAALAALWERASKLEDALATAGQALQSDPGNLRAAVVAARCERRLGRPEDALKRLDTLDITRANGEGLAYATFEKATLLDRLGEYERAYACYAAANRLIAESPQAKRLDRVAFPRLIERLSTRFTRDWVASWTPDVALGAPPPVFLIGFPRSGTTLLEQILDAHPALQTMEEKPAIDAVKREVEALPGGYPDALAGLTPERLEALRRRYLAEAARWLGGAPQGVLVDKMPLNTIDVGLIHRLFPDAKLVLALRHPCDVVLSGFMQAFKPNAAMIHFATLEETARFYDRVMSLWHRYSEVLPLDVLATRYEDLVADVETEARRILAFLGVPWDAFVLRYAERAKARAIATPSYHQVVQPIYRRSVGRWRHYREAMAEVVPILRPHIAAFGYSLDEDA